MIKKTLLILLLISFVATTVSAYDEQIYDSVDNYYTAFANEDIDSYLNYNYLSEYSKEAILQKKESLEKLWADFDVLEFSYDNFETDIYQQIGVARFRLNSKMQFKGETEFEEHKDITMLLVWEDLEWKVVIGGEKEVVEGLLEKYLLDSRFYMNITGVKFQEEEKDSTNQDNSSMNKFLQEKNKEKLNNNSINNSNCNPDYSYLEEIKDFSLDEIVGASTIIGDNKIVLFKTEDKEIKYLIKNKIINIINEGEYNYLITTDSCTVERMLEGGDPLLEYKNKNIEIKGNSIATKLKLGLGKVIYNIYSLFKKTPNQIWVEAETGELTKNGKSSFIGATSRGPGEAYLAEGGATLKYQIQSKKAGEYNFYIRISDDAKHKDDTRSATFNLNDKEIKYNHISKNTVTESSAWAWENLGRVNLKKGENVITVTKDKTTSAAFIMDKFLFSEEEINY